jgi:hypothetical protein
MTEPESDSKEHNSNGTERDHRDGKPCPVCGDDYRWYHENTDGESLAVGGAVAVCITGSRLYLHDEWSEE